MALSKNGHFSTFFLYAIQARKMSFMIFQNEKTSFYAIKTRSSISRIIDIFLNGLTHGLGPKMAIFQPFFYAYRPGKCLYDILEQENAFLGYNNKKFTQSKNCHFSKRVNPWFWSKNGHFPHFFFFQVIQVRKMSFMIFYNEKTPLQAIKTIRSKSRKIDICPKGLTHGFRPKMVIFQTVSFLSIQAREMSFIILQHKNYAFLGYKNKKIKRAKN